MLLSAIPILACLNKEETIVFYTDKLGFKFQADWDGYLIFDRNQVSIHLWPCDEKHIAESTGCYVRVSDVDQLYAEYKANGLIHPNGDLKQQPWGMKQFSVLDNNGNIIHFGQDMK